MYLPRRQPFPNHEPIRSRAGHPCRPPAQVREGRPPDHRAPGLRRRMPDRCFVVRPSAGEIVSPSVPTAAGSRARVAGQGTGLDDHPHLVTRPWAVPQNRARAHGGTPGCARRVGHSFIKGREWPSTGSVPFGAEHSANFLTSATSWRPDSGVCSPPLAHRLPALVAQSRSALGAASGPRYSSRYSRSPAENHLPPLMPSRDASGGGWESRVYADRDGCRRRPHARRAWTVRCPTAAWFQRPALPNTSRLLPANVRGPGIEAHWWAGAGRCVGDRAQRPADRAGPEPRRRTGREPSRDGKDKVTCQIEPSSCFGNPGLPQSVHAPRCGGTTAEVLALHGMRAAFTPYATTPGCLLIRESTQRRVGGCGRLPSCCPATLRLGA